MPIYDVEKNVTGEVQNVLLVEKNLTVGLDKAYLVENGLTSLLWSSGVEAGEVIFTESQTWTVPEGVTNIDIFCVGGGGGAGGSYSYYYTSTCGKAGGGGGGGYTTTKTSIEVSPGDELDIVVGAGGASGVCYWYDYYNTPKANGSTSGITNGSAGGVSSVYDANGTLLCSANGGNGGTKIPTAGTAYANARDRRGGAGGAGGSGGSGGFYELITSSVNLYSGATSYGTDGSNGGNAEDLNNGTYSNTGATGGTGQGRTTRAFGESGATLYSNGGGGCGNGIPNRGANTGDGAGICWQFIAESPYMTDGDGKSGAVIIRWGAQ